MTFIRSIVLISGILCCTRLSAAPGAPQNAKPKEPQERAAANADSNKNAPISAGDKMRSLPPAERGWEILRAGIAFDNAEKRAKAICALGMLKGNAEAEKLAVAGLKDQNGDVRAAAANALGAMHATSARTPLEVALDDREPAVVLAAANSLMLLKDPKFAYDVYYGVLTGSMRTSGNPIKAEMKE